MSELKLKPAGDPGKWSLMVAGAGRGVALNDGSGFWVDLENVSDDDLADVCFVIEEYFEAKELISEEDIRAGLLAIHRRKVITWWCLAVVWMIVISFAAFEWGKTWRN